MFTGSEECTNMMKKWLRFTGPPLTARKRRKLNQRALNRHRLQGALTPIITIIVSCHSGVHDVSAKPADPSPHPPSLHPAQPSSQVSKSIFRGNFNFLPNRLRLLYFSQCYFKLKIHHLFKYWKHTNWIQFHITYQHEEDAPALHKLTWANMKAFCF